MAWRMLEKPKTILASRSLVDEFTNMEPAPHDRPLSEKRMQVYERILRNKEFRPVTWASVLCAETGATYRVNGKHTSKLLSGFDPIPEFYIIVERWYADTLNDVGKLYGTYDSSLGSRTAKDVNLAFSATIPSLVGVPEKLIHLTVTAAANLKWDDNELRKTSPAERAEELLEREDFIPWLRDVMPTGVNRGNLGRHLMRSPVVQAMMATYDRGPRIAKEFWVQVRDESAPDRNDPTRTIGRFLIRAVIGGSRSKVAQDQKIVSSREVYVKCLSAWNAWRKGEQPTNFAYHANAPIPPVSK